MTLSIFFRFTMARGVRYGEAVPHGPSTIRTRSRAADSVTFQHTLVIGGHVAGTWRRMQNARAAAIDVVPLRRLSRLERLAVGDAAARYEQFLCAPVTCSIR
jgi:hypothetical protein